MSAAVTWTNAMSLTLLEEFRKRPALWDPKNNFYFNGPAKEGAWDEICNAVRQSKVECKRKMESLKGSFRRERSRKVKLGPNGSFKTKWFAYDAMKFLDEREDPRACYSNPPPELFGEVKVVGDKAEVLPAVQSIKEGDFHWEIKSEHEFEADLDEEDDTPVDCEPFPMVNVDELIPEPEDTFTSRKRPYSEVEKDIAISDSFVIKSSPEDTSPIQDIGTGTQENSTNATSSGTQSPRRDDRPTECTCADECTTYGRHVANKLRKLDDRSRALVQHKINALLFKAEMKMFGLDDNV